MFKLNSLVCSIPSELCKRIQVILLHIPDITKKLKFRRRQCRCIHF